MTHAKRLDACRKNWRWMPRMKLQPRDGYALQGIEWTVLAVKGERIQIVRYPHNMYLPSWSPADPWVPDLTDPATRGCLRHQIREKLGVDWNAAYYGDLVEGKGWITFLDGEVREYICEEDCFLAALEAL
jgi:hypothetical protein